MTTTITHHSIAPLAPVADLIDQAKSYVEQVKAGSTRRAYAGDWQHFTTWCDAHALVSLPATPETIVLYVTDQAQHHKAATIQRRLVAISQVHQAARFDSPTANIAVCETMKGIRRVIGTAQAQKAPAVLDDLRAMLDTLPTSTIGIRDRALLLIGFAGAFRRSELVSFDRKDVVFSREGASLLLKHSKTDQEGQGQLVAIPYGLHDDTCPVLALQAWLATAGILDGPIFRPVNRHGQVAESRLTSQTVAAVVKRCALRAGLDPDQYAGHSLRSGLATQAATAGVEERDIMRQTRHKSVIIARKADAKSTFAIGSRHEHRMSELDRTPTGHGQRQDVWPNCDFASALSSHDATFGRTHAGTIMPPARWGCDKTGVSSPWLTRGGVACGRTVLLCRGGQDEPCQYQVQ